MSIAIPFLLIEFLTLLIILTKIKEIIFSGGQFMRITKTAVIQAAADIADDKGLNNVSLKVVAEKLHIRTPSLYNHINNLDDLLLEVAHAGMRTMNQRMIQAAIGKSGDAAMHAVAIEYLNYMIEHCGVYETIQWATWHGTNETAAIFSDYTNLLKTLILSYNFETQKVPEILNLLMGFFHGYTTLQLRYAFSDAEKVRNELHENLDTVLAGIHQKYDHTISAALDSQPKE